MLIFYKWSCSQKYLSGTLVRMSNRILPVQSVQNVSQFLSITYHVISKYWLVLSYVIIYWQGALALFKLSSVTQSTVIQGCVNFLQDLKVQGLFVPFARVGSDDPVKVLRLFHNKYTGYNWSIYCWDYVQLVATESNVVLY